MKIIGGFEDLGEIAQEAGQNITQQVKKQAQSAAQTTVAQITGNQTQQTNNNAQGTNEQANAAKQKMSDDQAKQFLQDLYGVSKPQDKNSNQNSNKPPVVQNTVSQAMGLPQADPNKGKSPEEIAKMASLQNQLHADYYKTLTTPKPQEEHIAEKLEREEHEEQMADIEKEKKKPRALPITVKQGTGENVVGVSG